MVPMDLDYLNEDLKNMGPLPAAKIKKPKRTYYAIPATPGPEVVKIPVFRKKKSQSSEDVHSTSEQ